MSYEKLLNERIKQLKLDLIILKKARAKLRWNRCLSWLRVWEIIWLKIWRGFNLDNVLFLTFVFFLIGLIVVGLIYVYDKRTG